MVEEENLLLYMFYIYLVDFYVISFLFTLRDGSFEQSQ